MEDTLVLINLNLESSIDNDNDSEIMKIQKIRRLFNAQQISFHRKCDGCKKHIPLDAKELGRKCKRCGARFDLCIQCQNDGLNQKECPSDYGCKMSRIILSFAKFRRNSI